MNSNSKGELNAHKLENMVKTPTWKELLINLIIKNKLDPWDIDIKEITSAYIQKIKEMKDLELNIPANMVLASSILLRFQSDSVILNQEEQVNLYIPEEECNQIFDIPKLEMVSRIPPKRKITLSELVTAVEKVFEDQQIRNAKNLNKNYKKTKTVSYKIEYDNIKRKQVETFHLLKEKKDQNNMVLFSNIIKNQSKQNIMLLLLYLLFLANEKKISLLQEICFGDIIITIKDLRWNPQIR